MRDFQSLSAMEDPRGFMESIWNYLKPRGGPAPRAHLFTINGLTYPIHRDYCFAAVPDPYDFDVKRRRVIIQRSKRRYSMLAYLHSVREGDLLFCFQADPQMPGASIHDRRGFRGIWIVASRPFRDTATITHPTGYEILGECPNCKAPFNFGSGRLGNGEKRCPLCGEEYGTVTVGLGNNRGRFSRVVLSARILIKPLVIFRRTTGDNRVYSDMTIPPLIWISRTDNAMGPGKGSSIRTLLPEEAAKIAYMLATEDAQEAIEHHVCKPYPGRTDEVIKDHNGVDVVYPRLVRRRATYELEHELHLNLYFSMRIDNPEFPLVEILGLPLERLEYWSTEFPWGYTGDTADFVASLWDDEMGRYKIYLFEFKKGAIDRQALAETLLYIPWVTQVLVQFRPETREVEVEPVMVGRSIRLHALPENYTIDVFFFPSGKKTIHVLTPRAIVYEPISVFRNGDYYYARDLDFREIRLPIRSGFRPPPPSLTTSVIERQWVVDNYLRMF